MLSQFTQTDRVPVAEKGSQAVLNEEDNRRAPLPYNKDEFVLRDEVYQFDSDEESPNMSTISGPSLAASPNARNPLLHRRRNVVPSRNRLVSDGAMDDDNVIEALVDARVDAINGKKTPLVSFGKSAKQQKLHQIRERLIKRKKQANIHLMTKPSPPPLDDDDDDMREEKGNESSEEEIQEAGINETIARATANNRKRPRQLDSEDEVEETNMAPTKRHIRDKDSDQDDDDDESEKERGGARNTKNMLKKYVMCRWRTLNGMKPAKKC